MRSGQCHLLILALDSFHFALNSKWPVDFSSFLLGSVTCVCPEGDIKIGRGAQGRGNSAAQGAQPLPRHVACSLSAVERAQGHWAWKPDSVADAFLWPRKLCGERSERYLVPGRAPQGHLNRLHLTRGPTPFSALTDPPTGQLRPFPEILHLLPSADPHMKNKSRDWDVETIFITPLLCHRSEHHRLLN